MDTEMVRRAVRKLETDVLTTLQEFEDATGTFVYEVKPYYAKNKDGTRRVTVAVAIGASIETEESQTERR